MNHPIHFIVIRIIVSGAVREITRRKPPTHSLRLCLIGVLRAACAILSLDTWQAIRLTIGLLRGEKGVSQKRCITKGV